MEKTKTEKIINITKEQAKLWQNNGEFVYIEPLITNVSNLIYIKEGNYLNEVGTLNQYHCPYKVGDKVKIRQPWKWDFSKGIENKFAREDGIFEGKVLQPTKQMPEELWETGTIEEILEPARVQNIQMYIIYSLGIRSSPGGCGAASENNSMLFNFKDYFNKQFAESRPVECKQCKGSGIHITETKNSMWMTCDNCNNGIEKYIRYVYDNVPLSSEVNSHKSDMSYFTYKDRPLETIIDPWVWLIKIKS